MSLIIKMKEKSIIYLDYNATTPIDHDVQRSMFESCKELWGNPSSSYDVGKLAADAIESSRGQVAAMVNASSRSDIIFTSGGTESNNWLLTSLVEHAISSGIDKPHLIATNIEHDSIRLPIETMRSHGKIESTFVPVIAGVTCPESVVASIRRNTVLVTIMLANNETGLLQPVKQISMSIKLINEQRQKDGLQRIWIHTDAAQAFGKIIVDVEELGVDYMTIVGHKFYAPRIGALYVNQNAPIYPLFYGGGQERGLRSGTPNTMCIVGLGKAAELVAHNLDTYESSLRGIQQYLEERLYEVFHDEIFINGSTSIAGRLPNTTSVSFIDDRLTGSALLKLCTRIRASVGAACHSTHDGDSYAPSAVLINSGVLPQYAACTLRLSVGRETQKSDIDIVVSELVNAVNILKATRIEQSK